jgi:hypothetical protein
VAGLESVSNQTFNQLFSGRDWKFPTATVIASVDLLRTIQFSSFDIEKELEVINESIKIFVEQTA